MNNIGVDIGKKQCVVCVMDVDGNILEETSYPNTRRCAESFARMIQMKHGECKAVCESTGNMWIKTVDVFRKCDIDTKLANPRKLKWIAESSVKTDKIDAKVLANLLRLDAIPECHVLPADARTISQVLRHRVRLVQNRTHVANQLHALLDRYDIDLTKSGSSRLVGPKCLEWLQDAVKETDDWFVMANCVEHMQDLNSWIRHTDRRIAAAASYNDDAQLLMTITGIDYFGAVLLATEIDGIKRFGSWKKLVSWAGMCPRVHQSGDTTYHGRMKKDSNRLINWIMIQIALSASRHDPKMAEVYERARRTHPHGVAVTHVATKLLMIIWHMLTHREKYRFMNDAMHKRKLRRMKECMVCL